MSYYCSFGDLQAELTGYYHRTGNKLQFHEAVDRLYNQGRLVTERPVSHQPFTLGHASIDEYNAFIDTIYFQVTPVSVMSQRVTEEDMIPRLNDVFIIRHPQHTRTYMHRHNYVEIDYVIRGKCTVYFEDEVRTLSEHELILFSPTSYHDIVITDDSLVAFITLRRSTFQSSFFSLLSRDDVLSSFFRRTLTDMKTPNYMIFKSGDPHFIRIMLQSAMHECHYPDEYSNNCCISLITLLFSNLLRSSNDMPEMYHLSTGSDFSPVLNHIRQNFRTVTLSSLADEFHYSKPHLCTLIKKNTGVSFSELIRQVRIREAREYLIKTDIPISDIAYIVGYNSSDNFSRVFRSMNGMSPLEYRRRNSSGDNHYIPLEHI